MTVYKGVGTRETRETEKELGANSRWRLDLQAQGDGRGTAHGNAGAERAGQHSLGGEEQQTVVGHSQPSSRAQGQENKSP